MRPVAVCRDDGTEAYSIKISAMPMAQAIEVRLAKDSDVIDSPPSCLMATRPRSKIRRLGEMRVTGFMNTVALCQGTPARKAGDCRQPMGSLSDRCELFLHCAVGLIDRLIRIGSRGGV